MKKLFLILSTLFFLLVIPRITGGDHILCRINAWSYIDRNPSRIIWLQHYALQGSPRTLPCVRGNLSGITFNADTGTLFVITNSPTAIHEINRNGECLRKIALCGFTDTEGIVYLYGNLFGVLEERNGMVSIVRIARETSRITKNAVVRSIRFNHNYNGNKGFEGIAYDPQDQVFYIVKEKRPMKVYKLERLFNEYPANISEPYRMAFFEMFCMDDFSGLHFDHKTRHLLFLSDESRLAAEVTISGEKVSFLDLERGFSGLTADIPQAEGITMDADRNIYIVSEPDLLYCFEKRPAQE